MRIVSTPSPSVNPEVHPQVTHPDTDLCMKNAALLGCSPAGFGDSRMSILQARFPTVNPRSHWHGFGALTGPITVDSPAGRECYRGIRKDTDDTDGRRKEVDCEAVDRARSVQDHIQSAWDCDLCTWEEDGHSEQWDFARACRNHPDLVGLDGIAGLSKIVDVLGDAGIELEESDREDIVQSWDAVRVQLGESVVSQALKDAEANPLKVSPEQFVSKGYERFISYAGWLQVARGNRVIILPVAKVAEVLFGDATHKMRVSRYRSWAVKHEFLKCCWIGNRAKRQADRFWFDVSRFPELDERANKLIASSFEAAESKNRASYFNKVRDRNSPRA